jgi:hypothetical protein
LTTSLNTKRITKEKSTRKPAPNAMSNGEACGTVVPLTQETSNTGTVFRLETTAKVAPVSSTLLANIIIVPANKEYFVNGRMIVLKTLNGLAPRVLDASSKSIVTRSMAPTIARTKYGYVMDKWAKIIKAISGMNGKFCQKMLIEAPKAMEGTIRGMFDNTSKDAETPDPYRFLAMRIAIGTLATTFKAVTTVATKYERRRLCQYPCQTPTPATA